MTDLLLTLRRYAREFILPVDQIKEKLRSIKKECPLSLPILDFGAGTLFWTNWFVDEFTTEVFAVDPKFGKSLPEMARSGIKIFTSLNMSLKERRYSFIFACDVFHHIPRDESELILNKFSEMTDIIIIKDIASEHFRGNLQNRIHDLIFNRQLVRSVSYKCLSNKIRSYGFESIKVINMPKFGYSHFLLIAQREKDAQ